MRTLAALLLTAVFGPLASPAAVGAETPTDPPAADSGDSRDSAAPSSIFSPLVATPGNGATADPAPDPVIGPQPSEEEKLWKRLSILNRQWRLASRHAAALSRSEFEDLLGQGRRRALDVARFNFNLHNPAYLDRDLRDDPEMFDEVKDTVLSTFLKLEREALEEVLGINRFSERRQSRRAAQRANKLADGPTWKMRLSPRMSDDYVALKLRFPYTQTKLVDHLSFRVEQEFDGEVGYSLQWDDGNKLFYLEHVTGGEEFGSLFRLSVRLFF